jgi:hypothetical protein
MALDAPNPGYMNARLEELQRENAELRERLRFAVAQSHSAVSGAIQEKETTERLAHQVAVEERATRAAVEVQGSSLSFAVVLQVINFFLLLTLMCGLFLWLPQRLAASLPGTAPVVAPSGSVVVPR